MGKKDFESIVIVWGKSHKLTKGPEANVRRPTEEFSQGRFCIKRKMGILKKVDGKPGKNTYKRRDQGRTAKISKKRIRTHELTRAKSSG